MEEFTMQYLMLSFRVWEVGLLAIHLIPKLVNLDIMSQPFNSHEIQSKLCFCLNLVFSFV